MRSMFCLFQGGCRRSRRTQVACSYSEEFPVVKPKSNENQELNLPSQPKKESKTTTTNTSSSSFEVKEALKAAKEKYGEETVIKNLKEAKKKFGKQGVGKLVLFGGAATFWLILSSAVLTSLEVFPLVPEAMQAVGLAYLVLVASRMIQGKNQTFTMSPVRAVLEIIDAGKKSQKERTSLVLPEDLEEGVVVAMERLAMERDTAVNQVQQMKMQTSEVSRILAEKEVCPRVPGMMFSHGCGGIGDDLKHLDVFGKNPCPIIYVPTRDNHEP